MKQDTISHTQLTALIWIGVLAPAAELLPAVTLGVAGKGAWLAPVAAIPLVLLSGYLLGSLSGEKGLPGQLCSTLGSIAGKGVLLIYIVWAELLLALRLRLCAQRLLTSGYRDGALWFFLLGVSALALWMGRGKLSAFARTGQLFLAVVLTTAGVVLALSVFQVKLPRVLPLWLDDAIPVAWSALPTAGVLGWGMFGAFLTGAIKTEEKKKSWHFLFWGMGGCLLLTLAQFVVLGNLGSELSARLDNPFFTLAKSVGVEGAFQRVESVITAIWTCADLAMAVLLVFAIRAMMGQVTSQVQEKVTAGVAVAVGAVVALAAFPDGGAERLSRELVPFINLLLALGVPFLLWIIQALCGKRQDRGISCGEKRQ